MVMICANHPTTASPPYTTHPIVYREGLLTAQLGDFAVLALDGLLQFPLVLLKVRDGLLSQFQVTLNLERRSGEG